MAALRQPPPTCARWSRRRGGRVPRPTPGRPECDETPSKPSAAVRTWTRVVDLVRAERDDAVARGGLLRHAQRVDGAGEGASEEAQVLASAVGVRPARSGTQDPQSARRAPSAECLNG